MTPIRYWATFDPEELEYVKSELWSHFLESHSAECFEESDCRLAKIIEAMDKALGNESTEIDSD